MHDFTAIRILHVKCLGIKQPKKEWQSEQTRTNTMKHKWGGVILQQENMSHLGNWVFHNYLSFTNLKSPECNMQEAWVDKTTHPYNKRLSKHLYRTGTTRFHTAEWPKREGATLLFHQWALSYSGRLRVNGPSHLVFIRAWITEQTGRIVQIHREEKVPSLIRDYGQDAGWIF